MHYVRKLYYTLKGPTYSPSDSARSSTREDIGIILERGKAYIQGIKNRKYFIDKTGEFIAVSFPGGEKQIDRVSKWGDTQNSLARELTVRIKISEALIFAHSPSIQKLEQLILFLAADKGKRERLRGFKEKYSEFCHSIQNGDPHPELEYEAQLFYKGFMSATGLSEGGMEVITNFSWANNEKFKAMQYSCHAWMIVVCILDIINLDKD